MKYIILIFGITLFCCTNILHALEKEGLNYDKNIINISTYENNFFLFHASGKPAYEYISDVYNAAQYANSAIMQLSIKILLFTPGKTSNDTGLFLAYTQKAVWELKYGQGSPFLEFNFAPEGLYKYQLGNDIIDYLQIGIRHESNGIGGYMMANSRAWNTVYGETQFSFLKNIMPFGLRIWCPFAGDDLPDGSHPVEYMGIGEINVKADFYKNIIRKTFGINSTLDAKFRFPVKKNLKMSERLTAEVNLKFGPSDTLTKSNIIPMAVLCQFFRGYGDTLLKLDKFDEYLLRIGICLTVD